MTDSVAPTPRDTVAILDFGSQYTQLIARRLRELQVYSEILPPGTRASELRRRSLRGIVLSGGPDSVYAKGAPRCDPRIFDLHVPVLGICYGMQLMSHVLGGEVKPAGRREYGHASFDGHDGSPLLRGFDVPARVWMSHGDSILQPPAGFKVTGSSSTNPVAAIENRERALFGILFHPEVNHTEHGLTVLANFLDICGCKRDWNAASFVEEAVEKIRATVGEDGRVICALSGKGGRSRFLAQGTLCPDVIESTSGRGPSVVIKSHHNVGGLPRKLGFKLIEPLRELFKDEVRLVGLRLGLDEEFVYRQPFPGPGLAVRCLGPVSRDRLEMLREADDIVASEVKAAGLYRSLWQSFAVLLPVRSVGVMGDDRTYQYAVAIRAVESADGMTADWARLRHDLLARVSTRIVTDVRGIHRVVFDISSKPPSTIEWE